MNVKRNKNEEVIEKAKIPARGKEIKYNARPKRGSSKPENTTYGGQEKPKTKLSLAEETITHMKIKLDSKDQEIDVLSNKLDLINKDKYELELSYTKVKEQKERFERQLNFYLNSHSKSTGDDFDSQLQIDKMSLKLQDEVSKNDRSKRELASLKLNNSKLQEKCEENTEYIRNLEAKMIEYEKTIENMSKQRDSLLEKTKNDSNIKKIGKQKDKTTTLNLSTQLASVLRMKSERKSSQKSSRKDSVHQVFNLYDELSSKEHVKLDGKATQSGVRRKTKTLDFGNNFEYDSRGHEDLLLETAYTGLSRRTSKAVSPVSKRDQETLFSVKERSSFMEVEATSRKANLSTNQKTFKSEREKVTTSKSPLSKATNVQTSKKTSKAVSKRTSKINSPKNASKSRRNSIERDASKEDLDKSRVKINRMKHGFKADLSKSALLNETKSKVRNVSPNTSLIADNHNTNRSFLGNKGVSSKDSQEKTDKKAFDQKILPDLGDLTKDDDTPKQDCTIF